jgi:uncharacterized protein (TIGR03663 family)
LIPLLAEGVSIAVALDFWRRRLSGVILRKKLTFVNPNHLFGAGGSGLRFTIVILAVAVGALAFRLPQLKQRPMHTDEAVHAEKFQDLLEEGTYEYDPKEYHGPTLNYFTLPIAQLGSAQTLVQCNETTLRLVPVIFGVGVVLLLLGLHRALGLWGAAFAAILMAISPAMLYYNRYYIQESLLVFFTFLVLVAGWQYIRTSKIYWALLAGVGVGLMHATKETCIIAYGSLFAALIVIAVWYQRTTQEARPIRSFLDQKHLAAAMGAALFVSVIFFTSFFHNPRGPLDSILTYGSYFDKAGAPGIHDQPWYYYLQMLLYARYHDGPRWSEGLIVGLALLGLIQACRAKPATGSLWFVRLIGVYTLLMIVVYSVIPYKTPWCMMGFLHGMILLAGWATAQLIRVIPIVGGKIILCLILAVGGFHLGWQAWRAGFKLYDDSLNPYVYAHTVSDMFVLLDRVKELAEIHEAGRDMPIEVICPGSDYWPLPWYLREYNVHWREKVHGYEESAPVVIFSPSVESDFRRKVNVPTDDTGNLEVFFPETRWLRPGVLLKLYVGDVLSLADRVRRLSESHPDGRAMPIEVICPGGDFEPLPGYLREFSHVTWREKVNMESPSAPVILISPDLEADIITKIYQHTPFEDRQLYLDDFSPRVIHLRPAQPLKLLVANDLWTADAQRQQPSVEDLIPEKDDHEKKN